ncbi:hypothetical protein T01_5634 [Trichinella spiralis]|uniref:Uncharacterized protein n=1 Tax=Trichinella spiralis TaxID=6334 RepID=A0A0V1BZ46_TRISP|nr:hypothetical protein T01_5634 [Trichinella spiralis]
MQKTTYNMQHKLNFKFEKVQENLNDNSDSSSSTFTTMCMQFDFLRSIIKHHLNHHMHLFHPNFGCSVVQSTNNEKSLVTHIIKWQLNENKPYTSLSMKKHTAKIGQSVSCNQTLMEMIVSSSTLITHPLLVVPQKDILFSDQLSHQLMNWNPYRSHIFSCYAC